MTHGGPDTRRLDLIQLPARRPADLPQSLQPVPKDNHKHRVRDLDRSQELAPQQNIRLGAA